MEDSKMYETVDDMLVFEKGVIFEGKAIGFMLTKEQMYRLKKSIGLQQAIELRKNYSLYNDIRFIWKGGFSYEILCNLVCKRSSISGYI